MIENTALAGDMILMHSLLQHAGARSLKHEPCFVLDQYIHQP